MSLMVCRSSGVAGRIWMSSMVSLGRPCTSKLQARKPVARELAVDEHLLPVDLRVPAFAQVHDHVPVEAGLVRVAALGVAGAEGEVDRAADLFVEEGVARVAGDAEVGADRALAEEA